MVSRLTPQQERTLFHLLKHGTPGAAHRTTLTALMRAELLRYGAGSTYELTETGRRVAAIVAERLADDIDESRHILDEPC